MKDLFASSATILVVDDDQMLLSMIKSDLSEAFESVLSANNGLEAIKILDTHAVDIVITDQNMPEMSGIQLIQTMSKRFPHLPVIMLTGNGEDDEVLEALEIGVFDILDKPYRKQILVNRIKNSLLLPQLVQLLWSSMCNELPEKKIDEFLSKSVAEQLHVLSLYSTTLKIRAKIDR